MNLLEQLLGNVAVVALLAVSIFAAYLWKTRKDAQNELQKEKLKSHDQAIAARIDAESLEQLVRESNSDSRN